MKDKNNMKDNNSISSTISQTESYTISQTENISISQTENILLPQTSQLKDLSISQTKNASPFQIREAQKSIIDIKKSASPFFTIPYSIIEYARNSKSIPSHNNFLLPVFLYSGANLQFHNLGKVDTNMSLIASTFDPGNSKGWQKVRDALKILHSGYSIVVPSPNKLAKIEIKFPQIIEYKMHIDNVSKTDRIQYYFLNRYNTYVTGDKISSYTTITLDEYNYLIETITPYTIYEDIDCKITPEQQVDATSIINNNNYKKIGSAKNVYYRTGRGTSNVNKNIIQSASLIDIILVYCYVKSKIQYFNNINNKCFSNGLNKNYVYRESLSSIAINTGISRNSIIKYINILNTIGLIDIEDGKNSEGRSERHYSLSSRWLSAWD